MPDIYDVPEIVEVGQTYWLGAERVRVEDIWQTIFHHECEADDIQRKRLPRRHFAAPGVDTDIYVRAVDIPGSATFRCGPRELRPSHLGIASTSQQFYSQH